MMELVTPSQRMWRHHIQPGLFALVLASPVFYAWLDIKEPLKFISASVRNQPVLQGGNMVIDYEVERRRSCRGTIERQVLDRQEVLTSVEPFDFTPGTEAKLGHQNLAVAVPVPIAAAPGKALYRSLIRYYCNQAQWVLGMPIVVITPDVEFTIVRSDGSQTLPPVQIPGVSPQPGTGMEPVLPFTNRKRTELGNAYIVTVEHRQ